MVIIEFLVLSEDLSVSVKSMKVFRQAINREKASIAFSLGMKELVPENREKEKIDSINKEEMKHIKFLSNKLAALKA